jgi:acetolactate synthase-1/2/3 large subunit
MSIGELATLAQEQLDVTVVVHNDSSYGMLRYDEERRFGRSFAVELDSPDFVELARSFGVAGQRAGLDDGTLEDALTEALDSEGPSLIEVRGSLTPPRVTSARWPLAEVAGSESKPLSGRPH